MKLPLISLRQRKDEPPRREPTLAPHRDSLADRDPCDLALSVPAALRQAITESCPQCGTAGATGSNGETGGCILKSLKLDIGALDEETVTRSLRAMIGRLEPRLV